MNERTTMLSMVMGHINDIHYTNHKGDYGIRRVIPQILRYGTSPWHQEPQWLLECWDMNKNAHRTFALSGIKTS